MRASYLGSRLLRRYLLVDNSVFPCSPGDHLSVPSKEAERFCSCPPERAARAFQEGRGLSHGTLKSSRAASDALWMPFMGVQCACPVSVCEVVIV